MVPVSIIHLWFYGPKADINNTSTNKSSHVPLSPPKPFCLWKLKFVFHIISHIIDFFLNPLKIEKALVCKWFQNRQWLSVALRLQSANRSTRLNLCILPHVVFIIHAAFSTRNYFMSRVCTPCLFFLPQLSLSFSFLSTPQFITSNLTSLPWGHPQNITFLHPLSTQSYLLVTDSKLFRN